MCVNEPASLNTFKSECAHEQYKEKQCEYQTELLVMIFFINDLISQQTVTESQSTVQLPTTNMQLSK